jgi:hypothetical protein
MDRFVDFVKRVVVGILILGIGIYAVLVLAFAFNCPVANTLFANRAPAYMFGLPICGITAFAVVSLLDKVTHPKESASMLDFKAFGLAFSGPAGPVTLWVVVYLALVGSMRMVS